MVSELLGFINDRLIEIIQYVSFGYMDTLVDSEMKDEISVYVSLEATSISLITN